MPYFHDRLQQLLDEKEITASELGRRMQKKPSAIYNLLKGSQSPRLDTVVEIAAALGTTIEDLAGTGPRYSVTAEQDDPVSRTASELLDKVVQQAKRKLHAGATEPNIETMLQWWWENGGVLTGEGQLSSFFDLYFAPSSDSKVAQMQQMGQHSLAAKSFEFSNTYMLNRVLEGLERSYSEKLIFAQRETVTKGAPQLSIEDIDVTNTDNGRKVCFAYRRLLLPVRDASEREYVLNFSSPLY